MSVAFVLCEECMVVFCVCVATAIVSEIVVPKD
jgi:hypothetical protein